MFDSLKICLFSKVKGTVLLDGKPVSNAAIVREADLRGTLYTDETKTDENGRYEFDAIYKMSLRAILPVETTIIQKMIIRHEGKEYIAWDIPKGGIEEDGEIKRPLHFTCDLSNENIKQEVNNTVFWGICRLLD